MTAPRDFGRELYPFLYPAGETVASATALIDSVQRSTRQKCADVVALRLEMLAEYDSQIARAAEAMADRFSRGGKLLAFGNGGSATDAEDAASDLMAPSHDGWDSLPALSLPSDSATVSALANDVGVESMFTRQLAALGERGDIALGISTSGASANVVAALAEARRIGMLTVAFSGYDGGTVARDGSVDFCFTARREFVPRIQEGHATLWHALLASVHARLANREESIS